MKFEPPEDTDYPGTIFFHPLCVYASILLDNSLKAEGNTVLSPNNIDIYDDGQYLVEMIERIAFLEVVKCSADWQNSQPTAQMKRNCPRRFLLHEIAILSPKFVLTLARDIFEELQEISKIDIKLAGAYSHFCLMTLNDRTYHLFYVIHPSAYGGSSLDVAHDLFRLKQQIKDL